MYWRSDGLTICVALGLLYGSATDFSEGERKGSSRDYDASESGSYPELFD